MLSETSSESSISSSEGSGEFNWPEQVFTPRKTMSTIKKWYGDDRDDENSKDFLQAVQRDRRDLRSNPAERVKEVELYLAGGGPG
jgi:hypothetical protein